METDKQGTGPLDEDSTRSLVAKLRSGDGDAGVLLDRLYRQALVRFCWGYLGRIEEAEDAAQDICYKVLRAESIPDAFRPWVYKAARNHCLNLLRGLARRKDAEELPAASQVFEALTGNLTRLVRREQHSRLADLVRSLPESQREVLRLRYVEDLARSEIAEVLEIPESLVKSRLFEGLKRLRDEVSSFEEC
jgi:RNA polymerase sigma-70 factor (ECF subfamily)